MRLFIIVPYKAITVGLICLIVTAIALGTAAYRTYPVLQPRGKARDENGATHYVDTIKPCVALTFDDGPNPLYTPKVLKVLHEKGVKGTFFVTGESAENYPRLLRRIAAEGHEIGNHGYSHSIKSVSAHVIAAQIMRSDTIIFGHIGKHTRLYRPPFGIHSRTVVKAAASVGHQLIMWSWSQDTRDWQGRSTEKITQHVLNNIRPGDIVLMHDDNDRTVNALGPIIDGLRLRNYCLLTVSALLATASDAIPAPSKRPLLDNFK